MKPQTKTNNQMSQKPTKNKKVFPYSDEDKWTLENWQFLFDLFNKQYPHNSIGGLHNPTVSERIYEGTEDELIVFKCHYDNFESEDYCWHWSLNQKLEFETH